MEEQERWKKRGKNGVRYKGKLSRRSGGSKMPGQETPSEESGRIKDAGIIYKIDTKLNTV